MKKRKKKNAITLLALVITIVIMLLLAGVAIQMTMGENGLIGKSVQAQKEQAKAELYDTAKLSYMSLNAKALENGQPSPNAEFALSTTEFTNKYNVVGDNITDNKGTVIDTKANVLNIIQGTVAGGFTTGTTPGTTTPAESWPKTVGGVVIPEEDKDKMILKLRVKSDTEVDFSTYIESLMEIDPIELDYGNGEKENVTDLYYRNNKHYNVGEYILKLKNIKDFGLREVGDFEIEVLQWGKILEKNEKNIIQISNVSKIYEPEPDRIPIEYIHPKFAEIPEWLFSKKVTSTKMSKFGVNNSIVSIPEGLFKNNVNVTNFEGTFYGCSGLTSIPEGLFKNNVNVTEFAGIFSNCPGLTSIPEGLFKNNVNVKSFMGLFAGCSSLMSIPEGLFKNNVNVTIFNGVFNDCDALTSIPEGLFKNNVKVESFMSVFSFCDALTSIPEGLFKNNVNVINFVEIFRHSGLRNIPQGLFKNNVNVIRFTGLFEGCIRMQNIPEDIIELGKKVKEKGGHVRGMFRGCTSASNYNSIPNYLKYDVS